MKCKSAIAYRPDIDGLRAVAVSSVLLYHAGISVIPGGFVGVDVFFVISGYLITSIIMRELADGEFSVLQFYERRTRRILPALFAVLTFSFCLAALILLPSEFMDFPAQLLGAAFFVGNIVFWRQAGYFSDASDSNFLLHTWSLGIEEQFYIFVPLLLIVLFKVCRRFIGLIFGILVTLSFLLCVYMTPGSPSGAFYLLPTRAWELGVGSLLALSVFPKLKKNLLPQFLSLLGLGLILFSVFTYSSSDSFPGFAAALPVIGAALIIYSSHNSFVGKLLSLRPMVGLGLISYSLYLWHWPIFVAAKLAGVSDTLFMSILLCTVALLAGWASWKYIETPFRQGNSVGTRGLVAFSCGGFASVLALGWALSTLNGWPARFDEDILRYNTASNDISPLRATCHIASGTRKPEDFCRIGEHKDMSDIVVWGDSHGVELSYALSELMPVHSFTYSSCPPVPGIKPRNNRPLCDEHNQIIFDYLVSHSAPTQIVMAIYLRGHVSKQGFEERLIDTVLALESAGHTVFVVAPTPGIGENLPKYLARGGKVSIDREDNALETPEVLGVLELLSTATAANIVRPSSLLCDDGHCSLLINGDPILFDHHHPSLQMSRQTATLVSDMISPANH